MVKTVDISCICPDLKTVSPTILKEMIGTVESDIVVFPEYMLELVDIPKIESDKFIVWGSKSIEGYNKVFIQHNNALKTQAKICLTPWESDLKSGKSFEVFDFNQIKIAVLICFDIEFPNLSLELKKHNIDVLIVPAATESQLGYERISRCASARSVELGCAVVTCFLIGETDNEVIDINVGNHNMYLPSQSLFVDKVRDEHKELMHAGPVIQNYTIPISELREQKLIKEESNPALEK